MASAPDTTSIPGYTIFRESDYESVAATAMLPQGVPHPLGTDLQFYFSAFENRPLTFFV
jgi:hypothetical protein